jgi:hypothetical protein
VTEVDPPAEVRLAVPTDMALVFNSWLKSYQKLGGDPWEMHPHDYFSHQKARIERLLAGRATVLVLFPAGTPNVVWSWACVDADPASPVLHYVYTVEYRRKKGYARRLVGARDVCTHMTDSRRPDSFAAWKRRAGMRYIPHLLEVT